MADLIELVVIEAAIRWCAGSSCVFAGTSQRLIDRFDNPGGGDWLRNDPVLLAAAMLLEPPHECPVRDSVDFDAWWCEVRQATPARRRRLFVINLRRWRR